MWKSTYKVSACVEEVCHHTSILFSGAVMLGSIAGRSNFTSERLLLPPVLLAADCKTSVWGSVPWSASLQAGEEQKDVPASTTTLQPQGHGEMVPSQMPERTQKCLPWIRIQFHLWAHWLNIAKVEMHRLVGLIFHERMKPRCCMLDFCAERGLSFWKQLKIPSSTTDVSSSPALGRLGAVLELGSVSLACISCAGCSLCPCQPLPSAGQ